MYVLGIETSCDETAAAVVDSQRTVRSNVISTQIPVHARYGGVVPELASRNHLLHVLPVVERALETAEVRVDQVDAIAVTRGPGLMGSLLIGLQTAKTLACAFGIPLYGVDHVEAHTTAALLRPPNSADAGPLTELPYVAMVASGGHTALYLVEDLQTYRVLGHTLDDAAGEAFDKVAKLMGLPYPGGASIDRMATKGDRRAIAFPRAWLGRESLDFSFSGLKTSVRNYLETTPDDVRAPDPDVCASVQEAIVDVLVEKSMRALRATGHRRLVLAGGVAANSRLRAVATERGQAAGVEVVRTPMPLCTDNAAMIAGLALMKLEAGLELDHGLELDAYANLTRGTPRAKRKKKRYQAPNRSKRANRPAPGSH